MYFFDKKVLPIQKNFVPLQMQIERYDCEWEHSSAGSEHLPYKQGVIGSNPIAPTKISSKMIIQLF